METNYSDRAAACAAGPAPEQPPDSPVVGRVPQGVDLSVNVHIRPGTDIDLRPARRRCVPREGAERRNMDPLELPEDTRKKLAEAGPKIVEWLNRDESNARLFLASPLEAVAQAGVELTRAEQKAVVRLRQAGDEASVVPPGLRVTEMTVSTGDRRPDPTKEERPPEREGKRRDDCGC